MTNRKSRISESNARDESSPDQLFVALATMVTTLASLYFCGMLPDKTPVVLHPTTSVQHQTELKRAYLEVLSSELDAYTALLDRLAMCLLVALPHSRVTLQQVAGNARCR